MPECDRSFRRDLRNLDSRLGVKWNGQNFIVVYDRGYGDPVNVYCVKEQDGGFRQPDRRDLEIISQGDLARGESMDMRLKKLAYASEKMRERMREKAHENIRDMTKDDATILRQRIGQAANLGKYNSAFRRIEHKPGKNVVRTAS